MQGKRGKQKIGKTRDLKKIRDTKGTLHAEMGTIKDRNDADITEAENIKKWQDYTKKKKNYTKRSYITQITRLAWELT